MTINCSEDRPALRHVQCLCQLLQWRRKKHTARTTLT